MRGDTRGSSVRVRVAIFTGTLAVAVLAGLGASIAGAAAHSSSAKPAAATAATAPAPTRAGVQLLAAGATLLAIGAVTSWLVIGGRRRERAPDRAARRATTMISPAGDASRERDVARTGPASSRRPRPAGRIAGGTATTLWRAEDNRARWVRRFDEQMPARPQARRTSVGRDG